VAYLRQCIHLKALLRAGAVDPCSADREPLRGATPGLGDRESFCGLTDCSWAAVLGFNSLLCSPSCLKLLTKHKVVI